MMSIIERDKNILSNNNNNNNNNNVNYNFFHSNDFIEEKKDELLNKSENLINSNDFIEEKNDEYKSENLNLNQSIKEENLQNKRERSNSFLEPLDEKNLIEKISKKQKNNIEEYDNEIDIEEENEKIINNYYEINTDWSNIEEKILFFIFSYGILGLSDISSCLRVCKCWNYNCEKVVWKSYCLFQWKLGNSWKKDNFVEEELNYKDICKLRNFLVSKRNLTKHRIEEGYSIMQNLLISRNNSDDFGSPSCFDKLSTIMKETEKCIILEKQIRSFENIVNLHCNISEEEKNDLFFLINNLFIDISESEVPNFICTVISKFGSIYRFFLESSNSSYTSFIIFYSSQGKKETIFEYISSENVLLNVNILKQVKQEIGLQQLSDSHFFFLIWKYCLSNYDVDVHINDIGTYLKQFDWEWESSILFSPLLDNQEPVQLLSSENTFIYDQKNYPSKEGGSFEGEILNIEEKKQELEEEEENDDVDIL